VEQAPAWFVERLQSEFAGRFRIRWSVKSHEWHIEQKVGRAIIPPIHIGALDDDRIRAADGYDHVLTVRPGDRMPCKNTKCMADVPVPTFKFAEVRCPDCRTVHDVTGYFPLNDMLLEWLRRIDPERGGLERVLASVDEKMRLRDITRERALSNHIEASTKEHWNFIAGIPSVGYTGKEKMWE
jgi:hypothetical protein